MNRRRRPLRRTVVTLSRLPALADRRSLRWLLNGKIMPGGAIVLITHHGRRTGNAYTTPVEALVEDREQGEVIVTPMRGERSDWYRNVLAGGPVSIRLRGEGFEVKARKLPPEESHTALTRYRQAHPLWGRMILSGMARTYHVKGDRLTGLAQAAPLAALSRRNGAAADWRPT